MDTQHQSGFENPPPVTMDKHRAAATMGYPKPAHNFDTPFVRSVNSKEVGNAFLKPNQMPVPMANKFSIEVSTNPSKPITGTLRPSPCEERPCYLTPNNFNAGQSVYKTIHEQTKLAMSELELKHAGYLDYQYFETECQWRMKYMNGSDHREIHVNIYWDSNAEDHIIEMNRVRGDGLFPSTGEFYEVVRKYVLGEKYTAPKVVPTRRPMMPGPPPLKRAATIPGASAPSMLPPPAPVSTGVSKEMFLKGIKPIISMAEDYFFEPRLEAVKALCDIAKRSDELLAIDECRDSIVRVLNGLITDEFDDIRQFAVMACSMFAAKDTYKAQLSKMNALHALVGYVLHGSNQDNSEPFETAQMRRRACDVLIDLSILDDECVLSCLNDQRIYSAGDLLETVRATTNDYRLMDKVNQLNNYLNFA